MEPKKGPPPPPPRPPAGARPPSPPRPPPPGARTPGAPKPASSAPTSPAQLTPAPRPDATGRIATKAKADVVATALRLRDEQLEARIVYFGGDQQTNSELDAITEQVVAELRAMQAGAQQAKKVDAATIEIELIQALRNLLEKLFSGRRETFVRRKIEQVQRRITTLYFNAVLAGRDSEDARIMGSFEQALYHTLKSHEASLIKDLESMQYGDAADKKRAIDELRGQIRQLSLAFLSKTQPELEKVLNVFCDVLAHFLFKDFNATLGEFAWEIIRESRVAHGQMFGYKIGAEQFEAFRENFDRKFLERLVGAMMEPTVQKLADDVSDITLAFAADGSLYSEVCTVICNSIYDYLHGEGFLDLPVEWKQHLAQS